MYYFTYDPMKLFYSTVNVKDFWGTYEEVVNKSCKELPKCMELSLIIHALFFMP